jgi:stage II sporulation protein D
LRRCAIVTVAVLLSLPTRSFAATLRIGVFGLFRPEELILSPAPNSALLVEGGGVSIVLEDGRSAHCLISGDLVECRAGSRDLKAAAIRASSRAGDAADLILAVPGRIERRYRGKLEVRASSKELVAIIEMDREVAVASVVAAESPPGASLEALKAQAVVTRSYYVATRGRHRAYDFCDTTHCQFLREPPDADSPASLATAKTRGLVLGYKDSVLAALFSACCGGRTRSLREVGLTSEGYPYFPVDCPPCLRRARRWENRLDRDAAAPLLAEGSSERARLKVGRKLGWSTVPGNNYSARFEGESVVVQGSGAGHGLGLCQTGAAAMAEEGAEFQEILNHYFRNTYIQSIFE